MKVFTWALFVLDNILLKELFFLEKKYTLIIFVCLFAKFSAYSQYVEFGEYQYRADRPPYKKYVTYSYDNVLGVVDSNVLPDRYTKTVIVVNRKVYSLVVEYLEKHKDSTLQTLDLESFQYIRIFNNKKEIINSYKFELNNYKKYLINFFNYIDTCKGIDENYKFKLISKLKYWQ